MQVQEGSIKRGSRNEQGRAAGGRDFISSTTDPPHRGSVYLTWDGRKTGAGMRAQTRRSGHGGSRGWPRLGRRLGGGCEGEQR